MATELGKAIPAPMSLFHRIWRLLMVLDLYTLLLVVVDQFFLHDSIKIPSNLHALLGTVLGLLLIFRTNTAYDRWWEGRKLWGQLVNDSRNLCLKVRSLTGIDSSEAHHLGRLLVNFARALKEHLREGIRTKQLTLYQRIDVPVEPKHVPLHIAGLVRGQVAQWRRDGRIDGFDELLLDPHVRSLMDVCGACERIRKTPLVQSYRRFLRRCIGVYLATLPWGIVDQLHYWTVPTVVIVAYFMLGLELIAEDVEEPFGRGEDDLMLDDICRSIETSIEEVLSRETVPSKEPAGVRVP